jgi:hypothetical protein
MVLTGYSGARGTLIHKTNLKLKMSCQTPFNEQKGALHGRCHRLASLLLFQNNHENYQVGKNLRQ